MTAFSAANEMAHAALGKAREVWSRTKGFAAIALAAILALGFIVSATLLARGWMLNRTIDALNAGRDVAVAPDASPPAVFARMVFLLNHARLDEAQPLAEALDQSGSPAIRAALHYDLANARLRIAMDDLVLNKIDPAIPLVTLARRDYREALRLDPAGWDIKFNTDVADRLIRDFPNVDTGLEDHEPHDARKLWKQVPGLPEGLP